MIAYFITHHCTYILN